MIQKQQSTQKTKDSYNASQLNDKNSLVKVQQELKESFLKHSGWVHVLDKYVNVQTGHVTSEIPIDISQFQQEIVRKFSTFVISTDDIYTYFLSIKNKVIGINDSEMVISILQDLIRELCSPAYYRECVDCQFFQQKCERMRKIIQSSFDESLFREFLDFLAEKRKQFTEQPNSMKTQMISELIGQASSMRKKQEAAIQKKTGIKKFFEDCQFHVIIEDEYGNLNPPSSTKKNKIIISNDKNRVSVVYEIIQKLSQFEPLKLLEIPQPVKDGNHSFQFELKGNEISILGEIKSSKQKAKESCCETIVNMIIQSFQDNPESESQESYDEDEQEQDFLIFSSDELYVAEVKSNGFVQRNIAEDNTSTQDEQSNNSNSSANMISENMELVKDKGAQDNNHSQIEKQNKEMKKENSNKFDLILESLLKVKDELESVAKAELNPFTILKKLTQDQKKSPTDQYKKLNNLLLQIILSAVKLYDYEEFKQSPCVLVQENNHTFFLKTLIMKKKQKNQNLVGRVRSMNEEQAFICSALEVIYKFAFKHQSHQGDITCLDQVINGLVLQAEYLSEEFERERKESLSEKNQFTDKMQTFYTKQNNKRQSNNTNLSCSNIKQASLKEQFKLVL